MVCGTAAIHADVSATHLLVPGLNTGHSAVECVYELHAPKTQLEGGIGCICLGSSFTHKHSHPADLQQGNVLFRAVRQTQLGQDPNRGSHGCTSGFFGSSSDLWAGNYRSACVFARSQTNHVKVANSGKWSPKSNALITQVWWKAGSSVRPNLIWRLFIIGIFSVWPSLFLSDWWTCSSVVSGGVHEFQPAVLFSDGHGSRTKLLLPLQRGCVGLHEQPTVGGK